MRITQGLGVALAGFAAPGAQESSPTGHMDQLESLRQRVLAEVRAGLHSDDDRQLAWAAWHVGEMRLTRLADEVAETLVGFVASTPIQHPRVTGPLAVALVRTEAAIAPQRLRNWWDRLPAARTAVLVLAARRPWDNIELLRTVVADVAPTLAWAGGCNLLLELDPRWLTRQLLDNFTLEVRVMAADVETTREADADLFGLLDSGTISCGRIRLPSGFPPSSECVLVFASETSDATHTVTRGPEPIGWHHRVKPDGASWCSSDSPPLSCRAYALACLHQMAGAPGSCPDLADPIHYPLLLDGVVRWRIPWQGPNRWERECRERLAVLRQQWARILLGLNHKGLLPESILINPDAVRLRIVDERTDQRTPLPRIE